MSPWWLAGVLALAGCAPLVDLVSVPAPGLAAVGCPGRPPPEPEERAWSADELAAALEAGRAAWRSLGVDGLACASCHAPEPLDFAVLGIEPAEPHPTRQTPADVVARVRRYIHALRRTSGLREVCAPGTRLLQPAHAVLPDDAALADSLGALRLLGPPILDLAAARAARAELDALDVRRLGVALQVPPLAASPDLDDLTTAAPPDDTARHFALQDAWLAARDEASLAALEDFTLAQGARPEVYPVPAGLDASWLRTLETRKLALTTRLHARVRALLRGEPEPGPRAHALAVAEASVASPCPDDACEQTALDLLPGLLGDDHAPTDLPERLAARLVERWFFLAHLEDPPLLLAPEGERAPGSDVGSAWALRAELRGFHEPTWHLLRLVAQEKVFAEVRAGRRSFPSPLTRGAPPAGIPSLLVDGRWMAQASMVAMPPASAGDWPRALRYRLNVAAMWLWLQHEALSGGVLADRAGLQAWLDRVDRLFSDARVASEDRGASGLPTVPREELAAVLAVLEALLEEVTARVAAAVELR